MEPLGVETLQPLRPALQPPAFPQQLSEAAPGSGAAAAALAQDPLLQHFTFQRSWLADSLQ